MSDVIKITDIPARFPGVTNQQLIYFKKNNRFYFNNLLFEIDGELHCNVDDFARYYDSYKKWRDGNAFIDPFGTRHSAPCHMKRLQEKDHIYYEYSDEIDFIKQTFNNNDESEIISKINNGEVLRVGDGW